MSTFVSYNRYPQPGRPPNTATTLALGEEGGGQNPNINAQLLNLLLGRSSADDIAIDKFNTFHKDADTQKGKVTGDGNLTKTEIENHLKTLKSQQKTYQLFQSFSPQLGPTLGFLMQPLASNIQIGQIMLNNFSTFATANTAYQTFPYTSSSTDGDSITLGEIKTIANRDGKDKYISKKDVNPWSSSSSSNSNYTSF